MIRRGKETGDYLEQIAYNIDEKVDAILREIKEHRLPETSDGSARIAELGVGGGESIKKLKENLSDDDNVTLVAVDVLPNLAQEVKRETDTEAIAAEAGRLPFKDESLSAINASAVFHEVATYGMNGTSEECRGKQAIEKALQESKRVLLPRGVLAYRDVLAPHTESTDLKEVTYNHPAWKRFTKWFLDDFKEAEAKLHNPESVSVSYSDDNVAIEATPGMQREIQRHYLMFRDYLRNVMDHETGISIVKSDWHDQQEGLKDMTIKVDESLEALLEPYTHQRHIASGETVITMRSDDFDKFYDDVIALRFQQAENGETDGQEFLSKAERWKKREGKENYIYSSISDLLLESVKASMSSDKSKSDQYVLFPASENDIRISPRDYYQVYLNGVINSPEQEGKQIITFRKLTVDEALDALQSLKGSELVGTILVREKLDEIERLLTS